MLKLLLFHCFIVSCLAAHSASYYEYQYALQRDLLQEKERKFTEYTHVLSEDEKIVGNYLEFLKWKEFEATRDNFLPSRPIKRVLPSIKKSNMYKVLKKLPKGGNMHLHHNHVLSKSKMLDIIMKSTVYEHLYVKTTGHDSGKLDFFVNPPDGWLNVKVNEGYYTKERLLQNITMLNIMDETALNTPTDSKLRWQVISPLFGLAGSSLINLENITRVYMREMLQAALDENVQYLETKVSAYKKIYRLETDPLYSSYHGKHYIDDEDGGMELQIISKEVQNFHKENPNFIGYKRIINSWRGESKQALQDDMLRAVRLHNTYPNLIAGYDMVGEEDRGYSLIYFMDVFSEMVAQNKHIPYLFHAAETNWPEDLLSSLHSDDPMSTLENIYDAIVLGPKRLGHGLGFIKHPYLLDVLKHCKIALEANPVSNMMLGYVADQRHHPAVTYLRYGVPVVLGSDDPATFGYDEFTVDWYEAFMAWGLNLADMKQLANNSLAYSAMSKSEKVDAFLKWGNAWDIFIRNMKMEACQTAASFTSRPVFTSIFPPEGSIYGGTKVRIFGRHFESSICKNIICKFGDVVAKGSYVYNHMITCKSPERTIPSFQIVPFKISFDNGQTFYQTNMTFTFAHTLSVKDVDVTSILVG